MRPCEHLLRRYLDGLGTQIEALDLDLVSNRPEGVPARRKPLHEPALDIEQTGFMVLDDRFGHNR